MKNHKTYTDTTQQYMEHKSENNIQLTRTHRINNNENTQKYENKQTKRKTMNNKKKKKHTK